MWQNTEKKSFVSEIIASELVWLNCLCKQEDTFRTFTILLGEACSEQDFLDIYLTMFLLSVTSKIRKL